MDLTSFEVGFRWLAILAVFCLVLFAYNRHKMYKKHKLAEENLLGMFDSILNSVYNLHHSLSNSVKTEEDIFKLFREICDFKVEFVEDAKTMGKPELAANIEQKLNGLMTQIEKDFSVKENKS